MKTAKKKKLIKSLDRLGGLLEKCGGPGGTPGPCPTGQSTAARQGLAAKQKTALDASKAAEKASALTKENSKNTTSHAELAIKAYYNGDLKLAAGHHQAAKDGHTTAAKGHMTLAALPKHEGTMQAQFHKEAASAHRKAAQAHSEALTYTNH